MKLKVKAFGTIVFMLSFWQSCIQKTPNTKQPTSVSENFIGESPNNVLNKLGLAKLFPINAKDIVLKIIYYNYDGGCEYLLIKISKLNCSIWFFELETGWTDTLPTKLIVTKIKEYKFNSINATFVQKINKIPFEALINTNDNENFFCDDNFNENVSTLSDFVLYIVRWSSELSKWRDGGQMFSFEILFHGKYKKIGLCRRSTNKLFAMEELKKLLSIIQLELKIFPRQQL
jgi:hypothetical protein